MLLSVYLFTLLNQRNERRFLLIIGYFLPKLLFWMCFGHIQHLNIRNSVFLPISLFPRSRICLLKSRKITFPEKNREFACQSQEKSELLKKSGDFQWIGKKYAYLIQFKAFNLSKVKILVKILILFIFKLLLFFS